MTERRRWSPEDEACDRMQIQVPARLGRLSVIGGVRSRSLQLRVVVRLAIASFWLTGVIGVLICSFAVRDVR